MWKTDSALAERKDVIHQGAVMYALSFQIMKKVSIQCSTSYRWEAKPVMMSLQFYQLLPSDVAWSQKETILKHRILGKRDQCLVGGFLPLIPTFRYVFARKKFCVQMRHYTWQSHASIYIKFPLWVVFQIQSKLYTYYMYKVHLDSCDN